MNDPVGQDEGLHVTQMRQRGLLAAAVLALPLAFAASAAPAAADAGGGQLEWTRHYGKSERFHDYGNAVAASANAIYVAVGSGSSDPDEFAVLRYGLGGTLVWATHVPAGTERRGEAQDIGLLPDGGIVITGYTYGFGNSRLRTMVLDPDGSVRWSRSRKLATQFGLSFPPRLAVGADGTIYVTGSTGDKFLAMTYDPDGERVWTRRLDPTDEVDVATSIAVDTAGNAYVTGPVGSGFGGFTTIRIRPSGKVAWRQDQLGALLSTLGPAFVAVAPDGRVVVSGVTESTCGLHTATTWSLDARRGTRDWLQSYPADPCDLMDTAGLAVRADGSAVIVGSFLEVSDYQSVLVSYGADGTEEWVASYGSVSTDLPTGIVVDGGTTFVTGATDVATADMDVLTAAFDRDGDQLWLDRYDSGSSSERPTNLVLIPGGDLVTTGTDWMAGALEDVLTLTYRRD